MDALLLVRLVLPRVRFRVRPLVRPLPRDLFPLLTFVLRIFRVRLVRFAVFRVKRFLPSPRVDELPEEALPRLSGEASTEAGDWLPSLLLSGDEDELSGMSK